MTFAACKTPPSGAAGDTANSSLYYNHFKCGGILEALSMYTGIKALAKLHFSLITLQLGVIFNN